MATPHKAPTIRPPTFHHENYPNRHAWHNWRNRDELISDVLLWTPTYGRAKAGRPARTYIQQLCEDTGCSPADLLETMNDREKWRERVRDIGASSMTWWWWLYIYSNGWNKMRLSKIKGIQNIILISSSRFDPTDSFDSISPSVPIIYCSWQGLYMISNVRKCLVYISLCVSANTGVFMWGHTKVNNVYEFVLPIPALARISCSPYMDGLWDESVSCIFVGCCFQE